MTTLSGGRVENRPVGRRPSPAPRVGSAVTPRSAAAQRALWSAEDSPWQIRDLLRLGWLTALGGIGLGVSWYGCAGEANFHRQIAWIAGAVGALLIAGFGMVSWILAGMREVHRETRELTNVIRVRKLHQTVTAPDEFLADAAPVTAQIVRDAGYVIGPSMTRVHRTDCPHVQGKAVGPISDVDIARLGLAKCGVCAQ